MVINLAEIPTREEAGSEFKNYYERLSEETKSKLRRVGEEIFESQKKQLSKQILSVAIVEPDAKGRWNSYFFE